MKPPEDTPSSMSKLMFKCWSDKPHRRPQFNDIITYIDDIDEHDDGNIHIAEDVSEEVNM